MELTQILLTAYLLVGICIAIILVLIYREMSEFLQEMRRISGNLKSLTIAIEMLSHLNRILTELGKHREDLSRALAEHVETRKEALNARTEAINQFLSNDSEKESEIWLDLSDPRVRQVYEYLKRKFDKELRSRG